MRKYTYFSSSRIKMKHIVISLHRAFFKEMNSFYQFGMGILYPTVLLLVGIFFMLRLRAFFVFHPLRVTKIFFKKNSIEGGVSPFRAVCVALAGTLGVGNIVGVAVALKIGGPGAMFWMWVSAFLLMPVKYAEIALALVTRKKRTEKGKEQYYGGPMYYIGENQKAPKLGMRAAQIFSVLCIFSSLILGNMMQINAAAVSLESTLGISKYISGAVLMILSAMIVFGGIQSIGSFCVKSIPAMSLMFMGISMWIIIQNAGMIPSILQTIVKEAFVPRAIGGGIGASAFLQTLRQGLAKGVLTHEAGCGTSPISHASANTKSPVEQGFWGIFEVFADTFVLCSMTALVILIGAQKADIFALDGILSTIAAYEIFIGPAAGIIISVSVLFFAFATVISWSYYGIECIRFLNKKRPLKTGLWIKSYLSLYCVLILVAAVTHFSKMFEISDLLNLMMTIINTMFLCLESKRIKKLTDAYFQKTELKVWQSGFAIPALHAQEKKE